MNFAEIAPTRIEGRFWRMLSPRWHHAPLSGDGAARAGGRWNAAGTPALYLSDTHATAIAEYIQALVHPGTLTPLDVVLDSILDLADPSVRAAAGADAALPALDWRRARDIDKAHPASWDLAQKAIAAGFDGLRVQSTQTQGLNLIVWRWGRAGGRVEVVDPIGSLSTD